MFISMRNGSANLVTLFNFARDKDGETKTVMQIVHPRDPTTKYEWCAEAAWGYNNSPHTVVMSYHINDASSKYILRSELILLLHYMIWKGRKEVSLESDIVPVRMHFIPLTSPTLFQVNYVKTIRRIDFYSQHVLLISLRAKMLRIIEAYFDGETVHLRCSPPQVLDHDTPQGLQQERANWMLRWFASTPVGNTKRFDDVKAIEKQALA